MKIQFKSTACLYLLALLSLYLFMNGRKAVGQYYYVINAYGGNDSTGYPRPVKTVFIDIDSKKVIKSVNFSDRGQIINKKAVFIKKGNDTLLLSGVDMDCACPNSSVGIEKTKIAVFNPKTQHLLYSRIDTSLFTDCLLQQPDYTVFRRGIWYTNPRKEVAGFYEFGKNYSFHKDRPEPPDYSPDLYTGMDSCPILESLAPERDLYRAECVGGYSIIKTNTDRTKILDSLIIPIKFTVVDSSTDSRTQDRAHILAVIDTLIYDFNLNYETYASHWVKDYGQGWIQNHVNIYDSRNFALLDSITVSDYPKGDYIDGAFDVADVIGPYIVYYFFGWEGQDRIAPAMLFIFDTRTNEATWLRVGWR